MDRLVCRFGSSLFYSPYPWDSALAVHPRDGRILVACRDDVRLLSPQGELLVRFPLKTYCRPTFTLDGERFIAGTAECKEWEGEHAYDPDLDPPLCRFDATSFDLAGKSPPVTVRKGSETEVEADISGSQFSDDARRLLVWSEHTGSAWIFSWPDLKLLTRCDVHDGLRFACLTPDATKLLCCCGDRWELFAIGPDGSVNSIARTPGETRSGTFLGSSDAFAVGFDDGTVEVVSPTGKRSYRDHSSQVNDLLSCEEGELLLSCDEGGAICAREVRTGKLVAQYERKEEHFSALAKSLDGRILCCGINETFILDGPRTLRRSMPQRVTTQLSAGCFSQTDGRILFASSEGRVSLLLHPKSEPEKIYAERPRKRSADIEAHFLPVEAFFLKDTDEILVRGLGDQYELAILGSDGRLVRHERLPDPMLRSRDGKLLYLQSFLVHPGGERVFGGYMDGFVRSVDPRTGETDAWDVNYRDGIFAMAFSAEGDFLAVAGATSYDDAQGKGPVRIFDWKQRRLVGEFAPAVAPANAVALSANARYLATIGGFIGDTNHLQVWDVRQKALLWERSVDPDQSREEIALTAIAFSHDSSLLAVATQTGQVRVYRTETGDRLSVINSHIGRVATVVFSPDDSLLATSSDDGTGAIWKVR